MPTGLSALANNPRVRSVCRAGAALMYLAILVGGSIPGKRAELGEHASGPQLHSAAYTILSGLCYLGCRGRPATRSLNAVLAIALMGAGDEFVQSFFPYRHADVSDWAVDCGAAFVTSVVLSYLLFQARARGANDTGAV